MKKHIFFISIIAILAVATSAMAADITVGASTWYTKWEMKEKDTGSIFNFDPAFLYGPALAVKFNDDLGLNSVFLYGKFDGSYNYGGAGIITNSETTRIDSDTSLSYRLNGVFKLFGGFKYMSYKFTTDEVPSYYPSFKVVNKGYGPAGGLSCIFPLVDSFYILANGSIMYLWGKHSNNMASGSSDAKSYGFNTTVSFAYYIPAASVTLSIGGRYQYLKWIADPNSVDADSKHKFYGVTASATYTFDL